MDPTYKTNTAAIEPFWQRLRAISLYPLQSAVLGTIAVYAVLRLVGFLPGMLGGILNLLISAAVYKYASDVLLRTAHGRMDAPEGWANSTDNDAGWAQVKLLALLMVIVILGFVFLGPVPGIVLLVVVGLAMPGATMSAAIDANVWLALNPATWLQVMSRVGWPYFVVAALCLVFSASQAYASAMLLPFLPAWLCLIVFYFFNHYVIVATFHLMGYMIYQYQQELGWEVEQRVVIKRPAEADQELLDQAEALVREGNTQGAEDLLREQLATRGGSHVAHERYRKLLSLRGDTAQLIRHGRDYLNVLIAQDQDRKALDLLRACIALDPEFRPSDATQVHRLAKRAAELGLSQFAVQLAAGFHRAFPKHPDAPRNHLLAAKVMAEKLNQDAEARALLAETRALYPNHKMIEEIDAYLAFLDSLAPKRSPA